jgi:hypothetical protein
MAIIGGVSGSPRLWSIRPITQAYPPSHKMPTVLVKPQFFFFTDKFYIDMEMSANSQQVTTQK